MMSILSQKQDLDEGFDLDRVLVEVYPQLPEDEAHAQDLFLEVNKAEPIKLVDMPGVAKNKDRQIITDGASKLMKRYPDSKFTKPTLRCAPHHQLKLTTIFNLPRSVQTKPTRASTPPQH